MHYIVANVAKAWANWFPYRKVAELGSYEINGNLIGIFDNSVGFDVVPGPRVDVIIKPGVIPEEHKGQYDTVIAISSFQFCPDSNLFLNQIEQLLIPGGKFLVTLCTPECAGGHRISIDHYDDCLRPTKPQLLEIFNRFEHVIVYETVPEYHKDFVVIGRKKL